MTSILISKNSTLSIHEELIDPSTIIDERTTSYDETYGAGNWLITPTDNLPSDFSVDTYTIVDGELVRLPDEVIAEREAAALLAAEQAASETKIARLKEYLTATDWAVVKCLEIGAPLVEIYPDMATERIEARASINQLEKGGVE